MNLLYVLFTILGVDDPAQNLANYKRWLCVLIAWFQTVKV